MKIAISGASGFVGSRLTQYLESVGHTVAPIDRRLLGNKDKLKTLVGECEAVINLAGEPINRRWTDKYRRRIMESRTVTTRRIVGAINTGTGTKLFVSTSAVGYYPTQGCYDEFSPNRATSFLADVCEAWEQEARLVSPSVRLVVTRFGVVLSPDGGAMPQMVRSTKVGIAAIIGSGKQPFPWIDREDLVRAHAFIIEHPALSGVFNFTTPVSITQRQFAKAAAVHYKAQVIVRIPKLLFKILYGKAAQFIIEGQCVYPRKLLAAGFRFISPDIESFFGGLSEGK